MNQFCVMRRANGEVFTIMHKGKEVVAVWSSIASAMHSKLRNPDLLVYSPSTTASPLMQQRLTPLQKAGVGLFLLSDTNEARLSEGRKMDWKELAGW